MLNGETRTKMNMTVLQKGEKNQEHRVLEEKKSMHRMPLVY